MNMDDIPLPDDIPVPQEGEVSCAHLDTTIPELTLDTIEENEHHKIIENVVEDETNKRFFNVDTSVSCVDASVPDTNCSVLGIDTSTTDVSTSSPKNEMYSPGDSAVGPDENISSLEVPESLTDVAEQQENRDSKVHSEDSADDQYSFSERHELLTSRADVPVPGESEHEFYMEGNQEFSLNDQSNNEQPKQSSAEIPLPVTDTYPPQLPESGAPPEPSYIIDNSTNLQNNQVQYSTTNYMAYPTHMADPSMMSHNYSYMTAPSNYSDYLSMYHAAGRMPPRPYPNAYASYQGYNYAYPMQQMYDGRNMAAYTPGNYPTQMLPPTPPLPPGQPAPPQLNTFNPPLPSDYSATSFPSKDSVSRTTKTDNQQQLQVEPDQSKLNIGKDTLSLPKRTASEEQLTNDTVEDQNVEEYDPVYAPSAESETESGKLMTSEQSNILVENHVLSEDVNRYSPSLPMDEDDANNQSESAESALQIRPPQKTSSVLGKAQAKKRLMAFSISKQAAAAHIAAKKQAQELASSSTSTSLNSVTGKSVNKKENGDVSVEETNNLSIENADVRNVFEDKHQKKKLKKSGQKERARETIEEIEEIKRTEMLMRDSSLIYRQSLLSDLSDSQKRSSDSRKRSHSRSRRSRSRSRDRKSKRRSKKYRRRSRSRSRSRSGSQSRSGSRHRDKKSKVKTSEIKSWTEFAEAGFQLDRYRRVKFNENKNFLESEVERRKKEESKHRHRRSRSQDRKSISIEKEVVEECRKKKVNFLQTPMEIKQPVVCVRAGPAEEVVEYPSRIIQYTNTRPILKYCENPSRATCHLISREELLETVPDDIAVLIKQFWNSIRLKRLKSKEIQGNNSNNENESGDIIDNRESKTVQWWSANPLHEENLVFCDSDVEEDREDPVQDDTAFVSSDNVNNSIAEYVPVKSLERAPGVRKSRFEEAVDDKQDVSVVVRSRWDSDYEESPEKMLDKISKNEENCFHFSQENSLPKVAEAPDVTAGEKEEKETETSYLDDNDLEIDMVDENTEEKKRDSIEKHSKRRRDKRKHDEKNKNNEYKKAKSKFESPEQWQEEQPDWESETQFEMNEVYDKKYEMCWKQPEEEPIGDKSGDYKLVSEYEQFLKMVSSEPPNKDNEVPLYEGPRPPPRWNQKSNDESPMKDDEKLDVKEHNLASEDEKNDVQIDQEEEFDVDKFFMKEKEKKLKKMNLLNSAMECDIGNNTDDVNFISEGQNLDVDKSEKKRDRKDKKKKKASLKIKKKMLKNKKKRKNEKKKKKKHDVSSDSSSDSSDTDSDDSNSSGNSGSSSSSSSSSSSTTSSSSSSSSDDDSSSSSPKRKRKRSKKTTKKDKKRERKLSDKHKKKKKRQKPRESDSDNKKKRKKKNDEDKRNKSKKLPADNFLELIEKSLAVTLKKSENEESPTIKKLAKEKQRKRKKKSERGKKEKAKILDLIAPNLPEDVRSNLIEDGGESEGKSSEKSSSDFKKKKKKDKNKRNNEFANEETLGWKKKKIDPKEIEENVMKVQHSFLDESMGVSDWKLSEKLAAEMKKKKQKRKKDSDELLEEIPTWKNKKIDPKEIEESVVKAQVGSFFDENLDDWDSITTAMPVVKRSMRDDLKNVTASDSAEKKKKRKKKEAKRKHDKRVKETKQRTEKNKIEKRKLKLRYKRKPKKHRKSDDTKPCTDEDLNNSIALENIPIPEDKAPSPDTPVERNFAMFSSEEKKRSENEAAEREMPSNSFGRDLFNNEQESVDNSQNSTLDSRQSYEPPATNVLERYSPTTEYEIDEDETIASQISKDVSYSGISYEEASTNATIVSVNSTNPTSGLFPCFTKPTMHAIPFSPAVAPVPVPPPSPVPPPAPVPPPMNQSNIASVNDSTLAKAKVTSPLSTVAIQGTMTITPTPVKHFGQFINQESAGQDVACKSFSIGKLEVRTKAARKFVHSNIFDSFDVEEHANLEAPSQTKISEPIESAKVVEVPSPEGLPPSPIVPEEHEKEVFQVRECIALPEIPSDDVRTTPRGARTPSPRPDNIEPLIEPAAEEQRPKYNSASLDRNSKKNRHNKDTSHSHDTYRSRRSRSRTRSRSRDNRYKKRYRKDRYKRRSRSRSTSRNRRRSKDRDSRDHRYRSKRRSFSIERNMDRRRSQSGDRALKRLEPPISRSDHNSFGMDNTLVIGSSHWDREERRHYDDYYDRRSRERSTESAKMAVISEITRSVREMEGTSKKEISNTDFKILQANLCQLKETLQNLNKQGVQLDALHNVLSVLENTNTHIQSRDSEAIRRDACWQRENTRSSPSSDPENTDQRSESNVDFQKIISLCQAIQSTLPDTPSKDDKSTRSSTRSPQASGKSNVTLKTKKSVADSTNSGLSQSNKRFEMRSREISPKPLSLDERLELELGVKRAAPPSIPAQPTSMNMPRPPFYQVPVFENVPNFSTPPPPIPNFPPPMMNCNPELGYYPSRPPLNWNTPEAFVGQNVPKIPQPAVMMPPHRMPPPRVIQPSSEPPPPVNSLQNKPYRVSDPAGNKVHSIQIGNVLQIVPTEVQPASSSSQLKIPSLPQVSLATSNMPVPLNTQHVNTLSSSGHMQNVTGLSSILSAHLPGSFAAAPAVSGSKSNTIVPRVSESSPVKEPRLAPNDPRQKPKDLAPPLRITSPPAGSSSGCKITNLPLPPGTSDEEMKKLMRLAKDKRKEEKVLQHLLKAKGMRGSPATPNSDDSSLADDTTDGNEDSYTAVSIKPSPEQGILISPGFKDKSTPVTQLGRSIIGSSRKMVSFVDGIRPGAVTGDDTAPTRIRRPSPPPSPVSSVPQKKKHKVRVKIIRPDESDDDDTPPPPPPGPPPPDLYPPVMSTLGVLPSGFMLPKI